MQTYFVLNSLDQKSFNLKKKNVNKFHLSPPIPQILSIYK